MNVHTPQFFGDRCYKHKRKLRQLKKKRQFSR